MSENTSMNNPNSNGQSDQQWENFQPVPQKEHFGCGAWLGLLLLLGAVGAVLFFLVIKPDMEKKGVDVDTKLSEYKEKAAVIADDLKEKASDTLDAGLRGAEKARKKAGDWWNKAGEKSEDTAEKAESVRQSAERVTEKTAETAGKVQKKAAEKIESWY